MSRLRRFLAQPQTLLALVLLVVYVGVALLAPVLSPPDPLNPGPFKVVGKAYDQAPKPPSAESPLGTTPGQFDVYHTLIWGTRSALRFGLTVTILTASIGLLVGAVSGYLGGRINGLAMRLADAFLAFPPIAAIWLFRQIMMPARIFGTLTPIQQALTDLHIDPVVVALVIFSWMPYARLVNASVLQLRQTQYVEAARSLGMRNRRLIVRHLLPNALPPVLVLAARDVGAMVILESSFTFIGLGGSTEWGTMLVQSRDYVLGLSGNPLVYWWVFLPVTLALILYGIAWNLLGDGISTALNPWESRR